ncbi:uncharacterized protein RHOBADRAFT_66233, partial [Rhodotorula graminis WP1]
IYPPRASADDGQAQHSPSSRPAKAVAQARHHPLRPRAPRLRREARARSHQRLDQLGKGGHGEEGRRRLLVRCIRQDQQARADARRDRGPHPAGHHARLEGVVVQRALGARQGVQLGGLDARQEPRRAREEVWAEKEQGPHRLSPHLPTFPSTFPPYFYRHAPAAV